MFNYPNCINNELTPPGVSNGNIQTQIPPLLIIILLINRNGLASNTRIQIFIGIISKSSIVTRQKLFLDLVKCERKKKCL